MEYPANYDLTELTILSNIDAKFEWLTRDKNGTLTAHSQEPCKDTNCGYWNSIDFAELEPFNHLFQYIKWGDKEARKIKDLITGINNNKEKTEKINYWDIKKKIHEKNKEMFSNCLTDFLPKGDND